MATRSCNRYTLVEDYAGATDTGRACTLLAISPPVGQRPLRHATRGITQLDGATTGTGAPGDPIVSG